MPLINEKIVVEYSVSQNAFHTHTVSDMLHANLDCVARGHSSDYVPIFITNDFATANAFVTKARPLLAEAAEDKATVELSTLTIDELLKAN